ncbi:heat-inducible transcriptional repressor HrcA [Saccharopolyspora spinosporotrichia]
MNADQRRFEVLRAIVADYVSTNEPVGSKALVDRHNLGVSSATVRNDMATLEEEGLIAQPHTSAGRIPTDKGYRLFVDRLHEIKPLTGAERRAIQAFLDGALDLDDVMRRSVRLLAQLTQQVAVVQYPTLTRSTVRHVEVVPITPARLMLVLITDTGRVDQRMVDLGDVIGDDEVGRMRTVLNSAMAEKRLADASAAVAELPEQAPSELRDAMTRVCSVLIESLVEHPEERMVLGGTPNLTRNVTDFPNSLRQVLEALEEQVVVLKLLAAARDSRTVTVRIGMENEAEEMQTTSVVSTGYGSHGMVLGGMGVVGPTRMDYPGTMAAVRAVAAYVGRSWPAGDSRPDSPATRRSSRGRLRRWPGTITGPSGWPRTLRRSRSSGLTASSPGSCTPTSTPTTARRSASAR